MTWLVDPATGEPLPARPSEPPQRPSTAAHMRIERDEHGIPRRMTWMFCDDRKCCPTLEDLGVRR